MSFAVRYHDRVNRWIVLVALLAVLGAASSLQAQIFGPRASVTHWAMDSTCTIPRVRAQV